MSDNSFIAILNRMKARLITEADKREGTWTADNLQAVANELARIYSEEIENILPQAFIITANGKNLDSACSDYGITRREATSAEVLVEVTGEPGDYSGIEFYAGDIVFEAAPFTIPSEGTATVSAVCRSLGDIGNVAAGSIGQSNSLRITKVTNPADAEGGYDREDDETLRERALEHIRTPAISGNIAHYIQWTKEVPGVDKVRVFDLARGNGTVDVVLIADGNEAAPQSLVESVKAHIEEVRPIGADVLVESAQAVEIHTEAEITVSAGTSAAAVQEEFYRLLKDYCENIAFRSVIVSYLGITSLLFDCNGVMDVESYTINGQTKSLQMSLRQFPVACLPVITVKEVSDA